MKKAVFIILAMMLNLSCGNVIMDIYNNGVSPDLINSTIIFADGTAVARQLGSGNYTNTVTGTGDGTITYSSGTPGTATVNASTGEVTLVAVGSAVITASKAETSMYSSVTETYTITVTALTPSTIVFQDGTTVSRLLGSGNYTNIVTGGIGTGAITYTSGTPATATVNPTTGEVTLVAAGTTVITATKAASGIYDTGVNSYTLIVLIPSTIVFDDGSAVTKIMGNPVYTNSVSGVGGGTITYTSGTPSTASVDFNTGAVTLVSAGTTIITANKAATVNYSAATNTYTLTVLGIGSAYQGGKIAYILQPGDTGYDTNVPHGLIAAASDQTTAICWSNRHVWERTSRNIGTGSANTNTIITNCGTSNAAGVARAYNGGGYSDWYLPSLDELHKLFLNKDVFGGSFSSWYWTSSEGDGTYSMVQKFDDGSQPSLNKYATIPVHAVRSF